jgi:26S proteasome regulatory subunit N1
MGEELGSDMCLRMFNHLIQYGNKRVKRSVPLALALSSIGYPNLQISDVLSKLSHDQDDIVSRNAILSLGLIASGTNNARIARMLRALTEYYGKDADHLYMIRIAQGLVHMGKGLLTMKQFHSDRFLMSKVGFSAVITVLISCIAPEKFLLGDKHYLLYTLVMAIKPRMLVILDTKLQPLKTSVRVGQALDVVGQAGRPKSITGFQTHETPVLLGYKDRAELATDEYTNISSVLEGFAIVRPNKQSESKKRKRKKKP